MKSYEVAKAHFDKLSASREGQEELRKMEAVIQFELKDDESFYVEIRNGKVSQAMGKAPVGTPNVMTLIADRETVREIFQKGQMYPGLADFMFAGKLWFKGAEAQVQGRKDGWIVTDKPATAWLAKLLRMHP